MLLGCCRRSGCHHLFCSPVLGLLRDSHHFPAVMLEKVIQAGAHSDDLVRRWAPLAHESLENHEIQGTPGAAVASYTNVLMNADPDYPCDATPAELKTYRRRIQ
ncbi:hypothetical protein BC567DRAFT_239316 [Phyllosticta citribraziliensis]